MTTNESGQNTLKQAPIRIGHLINEAIAQGYSLRLISGLLNTDYGRIQNYFAYRARKVGAARGRPSAAESKAIHEIPLKIRLAMNEQRITPRRWCNIYSLQDALVNPERYYSYTGVDIEEMLQEDFPSAFNLNKIKYFSPRRMTELKHKRVFSTKDKKQVVYHNWYNERLGVSCLKPGSDAAKKLAIAIMTLRIYEIKLRKLLEEGATAAFMWRLTEPAKLQTSVVVPKALTISEEIELLKAEVHTMRASGSKDHDRWYYISEQLAHLGDEKTAHDMYRNPLVDDN